MQAHDQEILAVAFNPGAETLLITGSADKVRLRTRGAAEMAENVFQTDDFVARHQKVGETTAHIRGTYGRGVAPRVVPT
jgi:hypothetical protein